MLTNIAFALFLIELASDASLALKLFFIFVRITIKICKVEKNEVGYFLASFRVRQERAICLLLILTSFRLQGEICSLSNVILRT